MIHRFASLVPTPPADPLPEALRAARAGPLRETLERAYGAMRVDWPVARSAQGRALRAARKLGSSDRRFAGELLAFLTRHERTISVLEERAGADAVSAGPSTERVRVVAALVLFGGLSGAQASAALGESHGLDVDAFIDPAHALAAWAHFEGPTEAQALGVSASLPDWFAARLLKRAEPVGLAAALNRRAPLTLRVNRTRTTREAALAAIDGSTPTPLAPDGLFPGRRHDANSLPLVRDGSLDVQDEGSQLVVELCAPRPQERVLDACAGALGKSLAFASVMEGRGSIVASDVRPEALAEGAKRARRAGFTCIRTLSADRLPEPSGGFDLVLIDVPCTGSGALRRRPATRWTMSPLDLTRLPQLQASLLHRFAGHVRPGGRMVYATCSLFDEENAGVVDRWLSERPGWSAVDASEVLGAERAERIGDGRVLNLDPRRHGTDGFFAAVLTRS